MTVVEVVDDEDEVVELDVDEVAGGPLDTMMVIGLFGATWMPADGLVPMTMPLGTVVEDCSTVATTKPWAARLAAALAALWPDTSGTATVAGPDDTWMSTSER